MARFRMLNTDFWMTPIEGEDLAPEEKFLYLYLHTNHLTTQIGIYRILKRQIAFDMGYSIEYVESLMESLALHHNLIRYNSETNEIAIKNWGKAIHCNGGKPVMDCIESELNKVIDISLIPYVMESYNKQEFRSFYKEFYNRKSTSSDWEGFNEDHTYGNANDTVDDTLSTRLRYVGKKKKKKKKKNNNKKLLKQK